MTQQPNSPDDTEPDDPQPAAILSGGICPRCESADLGAWSCRNCGLRNPRDPQAGQWQVGDPSLSRSGMFLDARI